MPEYVLLLVCESGKHTICMHYSLSSCYVSSHQGRKSAVKICRRCEIGGFPKWPDFDLTPPHTHTHTHRLRKVILWALDIEKNRRAKVEDPQMECLYCTIVLSGASQSPAKHNQIYLVHRQSSALISIFFLQNTALLTVFSSLAEHFFWGRGQPFF